MAAKFPPALLEQIKERVPISRLVGEYVAADKVKSQPGDLWACCPWHKERTPSFHAEDAKGIAHCFGCGTSTDHFEFVERMDSVSFRDAVAKVAAMAGITVEGGGQFAENANWSVKPREPTPDPYEGYEFIPAPADARPLIPGQRTPKLRNPKKGTDPAYTPEAVYPYYNADGELVGYDLRVIIKGEKLTPTILWARNGDWQGWCHGRLDKMPILGLEDALANPDKQVLVVEGGKCRDAAREALQGRVVVVSWCGGTNSVKGTDWSPLAGRSLLLWPDHDEGGYKAMAEVVTRAKPGRVKWVRSYPTIKGADVADLVADGLSVADYIKANISETPLAWEKETDDDSVGNGVGSSFGAGDSLVPTVKNRSGERDGVGPRAQGGEGYVEGDGHEPEQDPLSLADDDWQDFLSYTADGTGLKQNSLNNAMLLLQYHDDLKGVYAWDSFSQEIAVMREPPWERRGGRFKRRLITKVDMIANTGYMETIRGFKTSPKPSDMKLAIIRVADFNKYNPVTDRLDSLVWDGLPRIQGGKVGNRTFSPFAVRYLGAENTSINRAFVMRTLISGVARAYQPGCKVDTMLVLEGGQGKFKSTSLNVLADALLPGLFTDELADPGSKDAGLQMQGKLIIEISELDAFRKSDVSTLKAWLARKEDRFRRPYGDQVESFPRSCIMIGTVNPPESGYLRDPTGARRWWPIRCGEFDLPLLKEDAEQIWAEARHLYLQGEQWHLTEAEEMEAKIVQQARYEHDPWATMIDDYCEGGSGMPRDIVKAIDIMGAMCLNIPAERRSPTQNARIEAHLNMRGWRKVEAGVYKRPVMQ